MTNKRKRQPPFCSVPGCGRKSYAGGLCQTHHRHLRTTGSTRPIRPYHHRRSDTVKYAGLRLTKGCAEKLEAFATAHNLSRAAAVSAVLEAWYSSRKPRNKR